jgi:hypothetical protein
MPVVLPKSRVAPDRLSPKVVLFYGVPKVGKTKIISDLPDCLILDGEGGSDMYENIRMNFSSYAEFYEIIGELRKECQANYEAGKRGADVFPYRRIAIDTVGALEDAAIRSLTAEHIADQIRKKKGNPKDEDPHFQIIDLAHGKGWFAVRERVLEMINHLGKVCWQLILIGHVKDKEIQTIRNELVKVNELDLMGRLAGLVVSRADLIGYLYREANGPLMVSFETTEKATMGAREFVNVNLAGKKMPFDWKHIWPEDFEQAA